MRRLAWGLLLLGYASVALVFSGKPIPTCLGLGAQSACVAAWMATLSPLDRPLYDLPTPLPALLLFAALVLATMVVVWLWRSLRRHPHRPPLT